MDRLTRRDMAEWAAYDRLERLKNKPLRQEEKLRKKREAQERLRKELEALERKHGVKFTSYEP